MRVEVKKLHPDAVIPHTAHEGDAGFDLYSTEAVTFFPGEVKAVPTGLSFSFPEEYVALVHPRSGLALKEGVTVVNSPGVIDSNYRGEVKVILTTLSGQLVRLEKGARVAQVLFQRVEHPEFVEVDELDSTTRNAGGFGSSGA